MMMIDHDDAAARRLLDAADGEDDTKLQTTMVAMAQVHATLALAAATRSNRAP